MRHRVRPPGPPAFEPGAAVAVLGLGVSGEAAARLAAAQGGRVYASDVDAGPGPSDAASRLRTVGIDADAGGHDMRRILEADVVVVSPGIDPATEVRRRVSATGIRILAEVELAWRCLDSRLIAVTGTNGKTTTTGLIAHTLGTAGLAAIAAGNIGRPLSAIALEAEPPDWVVVELSSFQLADQETIAPDIGVLLNLAPDHLDRYRDVSSYYADKARLFANADSASRWVLNADDPATLELAGDAAGERFRFSVGGAVDPGAFLTPDGHLVCRLAEREEVWLPASDVRLIGSHNLSNALAAGLACALAGVDGRSIAAGLSSFEALPHRLQPVGEKLGVQWINDSKATNVTATGVALRAFERPVVLILGGRHKGESYSNLLPDLTPHVRAVVAYGEAAPRIVSDLGPALDAIRVESSFEAVVRTAAELARPGDVVLLSPACSSYDMFPNYRARGEAFEQAFRRLPAGRGTAA